MGRITDILKAIYRRLPPPPSTNYVFRPFRVDPYSLLPENPTIFDIGSKDSRGRYGFGDMPRGAKLVCVDIADGPEVDLVADAHDLHMVAENSVDFVMALNLIEHVRDPKKVVSEIYRILKPGGLVYVNVPFVFPFHADPDDYYRFTYKGVEILCEDFDCLESGFNRGPASTMQHLLVYFLGALFSFNNQKIYTLNVYLFKWLLFWMKYLDKFLGHYEMAHVIHAGAYFIGRKPAHEQS